MHVADVYEDSLCFTSRTRKCSEREKNNACTSYAAFPRDIHV